ncbi:MAG: hypothetical protein WC284_17705 [Candidimonas sp.]
MITTNSRHIEFHHMLRNAVIAENAGQWRGMKNAKLLQNGFIVIHGPYEIKGIEIIKSIIPFETSIMVINGETVWRCSVMLKRKWFRGSSFIYDVEVDHISLNRRINDIIYPTSTSHTDRFGITVPVKPKQMIPESHQLEEPF